MTVRELQTRNNCSIIDSTGASVTVPCDSIFQILVFYQSHVTRLDVTEWGLTFIYQLETPVDSFEINSFVVQLSVDSVPGYFTVDVKSPNRYRTITAAFTPTSNDVNYPYYSRLTSPNLGLAFRDSGIISSRPSAVLTPYPNPAVETEMGGRDITFRFQVAADTTNGNITGNPLLSIDIFSVAGELVQSIEATFGGEDRLGVHSGGLYETTWNMQNVAAKNVASGVYLAYARLWKTPDKRDLLAESTVKVALIR